MPIFHGLIAAPFTAFHADGSLNLATIPRQAARLREDGVSGAFVCGTTGEGLSMTLDERRVVAESWCAESNGLRIIINASHNCLKDARELAQHAAETGAEAFATMAPNFFKPADVTALVDYCAELASACYLPFYFYHMPTMTGVQVSMAEFLRQASERIPTLAGIKFTDYDLYDYRRCLTLAGNRFEILFGRDEILLGALATGALGAVGSTYNYMAPVYLRMVDAYQAGELATAQVIMARIAEVVAVLGRYGGLAAGKALMQLVDIDCGPVRLPLRPLAEEQIANLLRDIESLAANS